MGGCCCRFLAVLDGALTCAVLRRSQMIYFVLAVSVLGQAVQNGALLELTGEAARVEFGGALTLIHNSTEDELVCSGKIRASDVIIEGTTTTVGEMMTEHAAMKNDIAALKQFVGMMPPPMPPPAPPPLSFEIVANSCTCHTATSCVAQLHDENPETYWNPTGCYGGSNNPSVDLFTIRYQANIAVSISSVNVQSIFDGAHGVLQYDFYTCATTLESSCTSVVATCTQDSSAGQPCSLPGYTPSRWWKLDFTLRQSHQPYVTEISFNFSTSSA